MLAAEISSIKTDYRPRRPQDTVLYQVVSQNWQTFLAQRDAEGHDVPRTVHEEFEAYLKCGILAHGFLRLKCSECKSERLVAFSCKKRGFCPSCGGRRMSETAAHLVDHVIPCQPIRQWVLSVPFQLRYWLSSNPKLQSAVLSIVLRTIASYYRRQGKTTRGIHHGKTAAITLIQRCGSALNLNVHFHILFLEGVFENTQNPRFFQVKPPTDEDIVRVVHKISRRLVRHLRKKSLQAISVTPKQQEKWLLWATNIAERRMDHILSNKHRRAYGRAAEVLGALAEYHVVQKDTSKAASLVREYRDKKYNRFPAFKEELRKVLNASKLLRSLIPLR